MNKGEVLKYFIGKGILLAPGFLDSMPNNFDYGSFFLKFEELFKAKKVVNKDDLIELINSVDNEKNTMEKTLQIVKNTTSLISGVVRVVKSYDSDIQKKDVNSFVNYFRHRYNSLREILTSRQELSESLSITRLKNKKEGEVVSIIGLVLDKNETKNGNIKITLEDTTGVFDVIVMKSKKEVFDIAKDLVIDQVVGITGVVGNKILFCNNLVLPEIPISNETKKSPDEVYAVFISDIHFGIKNFLSSDFMRFVSWLRGEYGSEQQREIASKVGYLFVTGDVVEGVGIYPGQEEDLEIKDIYEQYNEATRYLKMVPERIKVIICGGNHDAIRMSEPQPIFDKEISKGFYEIPNMIIVSNPAIVNIHYSDVFPGFNVLMYHGFSFPYFADSVQSIRSSGGLQRCDLIMKFLLQCRHLAPSHGSNMYVPDNNFDPMVIETIPDIFVSGHIHQTSVSTYRGITLINSSCWVVQSEDNAKRGIIPDPAKIPIINLKTREVRIMNFLSDDVKVLVSERAELK